MSIDIGNYICTYCNTTFLSKKYLQQHQQRSKICQKYRNTIFQCTKCNKKFCTGIKNFNNHIESCTGKFSNINENKNTIENLQRELNLERIRNNIYLALLKSHMNINIESLVNYQNNNIQLFDINNETKIFLQNKNINVQKPTQNPTQKPTQNPTQKPTQKQTQKQTQKPSQNPYRYRKAPKTNDKTLKTQDIVRPMPSKEQENIKFDKQEIISQCNNIINQISTNRNYTKYLRTLKVKRSKLLEILKISDYVNEVQENIDTLTKIFENKQQTKRKIKTNILNSLTPIDARLLKYPGYHETNMDGPCRETFKNIIKKEITFANKFTPYSNSHIIDKICNYSVAIFPIEKLIKWSVINIYGYWNVVYIPWKKSDPKDPYSFYTLGKINKNGIRCWNMNCRLEDFTNDIINAISPYLIKMFRELYFAVFNDNDFRSDSKKLSSFISQDCEQLARNIILLSQPRKFGMKLRNMILKECSYSHSEKDKFSLLGDDTLQRKRFKKKEKIEMVNTIKLLFDQITDEQALLFFKSRI